jgi:putative transposase
MNSANRSRRNKASNNQLADKAYDCAAFRDWLSRRGTTPVIPNKINRRKPYPHNKRAYRHRNKIERMFCRLKDARRIATRYDKVRQ